MKAFAVHWLVTLFILLAYAALFRYAFDAPLWASLIGGTLASIVHTKDLDL